MTVEIGDCMYRNEAHGPHTAVDVEGACIRGVTLHGTGAEVCGECMFFKRREHLVKKQQENQPPMNADGRG